MSAHTQRSSPGPPTSGWRAALAAWAARLLGAGSPGASSPEAAATPQPSEVRSPTVFELAPLGMFRATPSGELLSVNPQLARLLGYPSPQVMLAEVNRLGIGPALFEDPWDRERLMAEVMAQPGAQATAQVRCRGRDGRRLEALLSLTTVDEPADGRRTLLGFVQDVSERLRADATSHQRSRLEVLGQMTGGVAHDFNNLLAVILVEAHAIAAEHPELAEPAGRIREAARAARGLTDGLQRFLRASAAAPVSRYDAHEVLRGALELFGRVSGRAIRLETDLRAPAAAVLGLPAELQSAILNLLLNARDAMPDGGLLTVRSALLAPPTAGQPSLLELTIRDTGHGMSPEVLATCREPFFTTKGDGGTGLGLWTAGVAVERQGGTLRLESQPGAGTSAVIVLPLAAG